MTVKQSKERVAKLQTIINTPAKWSKGIAYRKIPNMALKASGEELNDYSLGDCRNKCTGNIACKSISFNKVRKVCYISSETMKYDDEFNSYLKKAEVKDLAGVGGEFILVPGIKLKQPDAQTSGGKGSVDGMLTLEECQGDCLNSPQCKSVSYSKSDGLCIRSDTSLYYDGDWDYYDKDTSGVEQFDSRKYDIQVNDERRVKAKQQLEVIRQQLRFNKEQDEMNAKTLAYVKNRPIAKALAEKARDDAVATAKVILPIPKQ